MPTDDPDTLIEAAAGAWRPRAPDGTLRFHPAWWDLDEAGRRAAHDRAHQSRPLEAALDPAGLSTTAKAVMSRIRARLDR
jgi:hypothetical protein